MRSSPDRGLAADEARRRLDEVGPNQLREAERRPTWQLFASQFANTMIAVLAVAAGVTFAVGDRTDTLVIATIVVLNAIIGFVQEHRAERAMEALRHLTSSHALVVRDGQVAEIDAVEVVPGDVIRLTVGAVVPADVRLTEAAGLRIEEAALTGESEPVNKMSAALAELVQPSPADQTNMAFRGTAVTHGRAEGIVVATGMQTELGRISELLGSSQRAATPLQRRLAVLGKRLAVAALFVCVLVFVAGIARSEPSGEMFLTAVSLAVAAIPESLPAVVTVSLALGARRMAEQRALIRRLPAVETLGSVTVVCTDKTGTLTENRMTVERVWTPVGGYRVEGTGYDPVGTIEMVDGTEQHDPMLSALARVAALCNDAELTAPGAAEDGWQLTGDPTEGALVALAGRLGVDRTALVAEAPRVAEVPFDADRRRMLTIHRTSDGIRVAAKGAVDALLPLMTTLDAEVATAATAAADRFARDGYRILALAEAGLGKVPDDPNDAEPQLQLVGLVGIADPPRAEVQFAIDRCRGAGITPVMITGDHPHTAASIARRLGLLPDDADDGAVMTGAELAELSEQQLAARIGEVRVFARTAPEQKVRIVDAWRAAGAVVAMTGDGVNDAPALKRADIGVAMGITGTDVAQEAADMVLADDHFATIVAATQEGRRIYDNVRRFVRYMLTSNTGEVLVVLLAPILGLPVPLTAAQILWINLVTDGLPAVALGLEPAEPDVMDRPPRPVGESILARGLWQKSLIVGFLMAAICLPLHAYADRVDWPGQTMVFTTLALLQLGNALASRSETQSLRRIGLRSNPWLLAAICSSVIGQLATVYVPGLQSLFKTEALSLGQLAIVLVLSSGACLAVEFDKWRDRRASEPTAGR